MLRFIAYVFPITEQSVTIDRVNEIKGFIPLLRKAVPDRAGEQRGFMSGMQIAAYGYCK